MKHVKVFVVVLLLVLTALCVTSVSASVSIYKTKSNDFNWQMYITGSDVSTACSITGAPTYANKGADWLINTYFKSLKDAKQIEGVFRSFGLPVPPAAQLTLIGLKAGFFAKIYYMLTVNCKGAKNNIAIGTKSPPYPAQWYYSKV